MGNNFICSLLIKHDYIRACMAKEVELFGTCLQQKLEKMKNKGKWFSHHLFHIFFSNQYGCVWHAVLGMIG